MKVLELPEFAPVDPDALRKMESARDEADWEVEQCADRLRAAEEDLRRIEKEIAAAKSEHGQLVRAAAEHLRCCGLGLSAVARERLEEVEDERGIGDVRAVAVLYGVALPVDLWPRVGDEEGSAA